MLSFRVAELMR